MSKHYHPEIDVAIIDRMQSFGVEGRTAMLYPGENPSSPLVVLNSYSSNGASIVEAMSSLEAPDCSLLVVGDLNWNHDMAPWYCPPLFQGDTPCTGGAEDYLALLLERINFYNSAEDAYTG